jgi:hypothetical protein
MQIDRIEKVIVFKGYFWKVLNLLGYKKWARMDFQSLALPPELPRRNG